MRREGRQSNLQRNYEIQRLQPEKWLDQVHLLSKSGLAAAGLVPLYPWDLDGSSATTILGAISDTDQLLGTVSFTADGPDGLHTDRIFPSATEEIRAEGRRMFGVWRISTANEYQCRIRLIQDLVREVIKELLIRGMQTTVLIFPPHQERVYRNWLGAKKIAEREVVFEEKCGRAILMRADIEILRSRPKLTALFPR